MRLILIRSRIRARVGLDGERKLALLLYGRGVERGDQTWVVQLFRGTRAALSLVRDGRTGEDQVGYARGGVGNDHDESVRGRVVVFCVVWFVGFALPGLLYTLAKIYRRLMSSTRLIR